ncbi:MAG: hypothetical protein JO235_19975 [Chroococcidiopsidaceae cyanobacterium CP_BM_RX_35]|nr:hypothetical protein [Chroococcidiopsidaceae cyanobacterium CP_BM_RX_35]
MLTVHPPYFINTKGSKNSRERLEAAEANREQATGKADQVPVKAGVIYLQYK